LVFGKKSLLSANTLYIILDVVRHYLEITGFRPDVYPAHAGPE